MSGQMSIFDLLPQEPPGMHEPGVYSKSGNQYIKVEKHGNQFEISIFTYNEAMIIRVNSDEFMEYLKGVVNEKMDHV